MTHGGHGVPPYLPQLWYSCENRDVESMCEFQTQLKLGQFRLGTGEPLGGGSTEFQFATPTGACVTNPQSETGRMRSPQTGGGGAGAGPGTCGAARGGPPEPPRAGLGARSGSRQRPRRSRLSWGGSSYCVYESVRKRVSSPTRIPTRQAPRFACTPRTHADTGAMVMRAGLHFRDGISALFRSPARPGTRDRRCIREQHIAVEYFSLGPGPISNARAHAALGLVNDLKCQSTRRPRSR